MDTVMNNTDQAINGSFWNRFHRFIIRMGYLRAAGELHRMGRSDLAKNLEAEAKRL